MGGAGAGPPRIPTSIMVSGNNEDRHRERGKAIADDLVFLRQAAIGQVAGHHDAVGLGHERGEGLDRPPQGSFCVDNTIGEPPTWPQMRIGDLGKDHGRAERGRPRSASLLLHEGGGLGDELIQTFLRARRTTHRGIDDLALRAPDADRVAAWIALPGSRTLGLTGHGPEVRIGFIEGSERIPVPACAGSSADSLLSRQRSSAPPGR